MPNIARFRQQGRSAHPARLSRCHLHGAIQLLDRNAAPNRMASSATAGTTARWRRCISGNNPITWWPGRKSGTNCARATQPSPARNCSGGSTCIPPPITPSLRARLTRRRPEDFRHLLLAAFDPPGDQEGTRRISLPGLLGAGRGSGRSARARRRRLALDCGRRQMDRAKILAHAQPDLSSSS
jgi:hypothetical protein